jgi:hypothetical protein
MTNAREESSHLADLLRREHHALAEFLVALADFDCRRRWESLGYRSLFEFLRRELKLSAGAAQYRKTAAELVQQYPEVEAALRHGDLCLSSVIELAKVLTPENAREVLPRFFGLSSRDAAFVAASIRPVENPPRRDFVVTQVRPSAAPESLAIAPEAGALQLRAPEVPSLGTAPAPAVAPPSPRQTTDRPSVKPLDAERARVSMTVSRRLLDKLAQARDALSHSHPGASEETILEVGLDLILQRHAKRRGIGAKPRTTSKDESSASAPPPPATERSRHVPAAVWRGVWKRDKGCCAWPLENGGVCGSTRQIELDHIDGWALGADTAVEKCRILCRFHQDLSARRLYGDDLMNNYTRPKGGGCSEPVADYGLPLSGHWPLPGVEPQSSALAGRCTTGRRLAEAAQRWRSARAGTFAAPGTHSPARPRPGGRAPPKRRRRSGPGRPPTRSTSTECSEAPPRLRRSRRGASTASPSCQA